MKKLAIAIFSLLTLNSQAQLPNTLAQDPSLVGYWPLDIANDIDDTLPGAVFTTPDLSDFGNDGVFIHPYYFPDVPSMVPGKFGNAVKLFGDNDMGRIRLVDVFNGLNVNGPDSTRTISFWVKIDSSQTDKYFESEGSGIDVNSISMSTNSWTHILVNTQPLQFNQTFAIYVNGLYQDYYVNNADNLIVGGYDFEGYIDDIAIWNRILTNQEILDIQNQIMSVSNGLVNDLSLSVYPNPVIDIAQINIPNDEFNRIDVIDNIGRIVHTESIFTSSINISMSGYPSGTYSVRVVSDTSVLMSRIVKN